YEREVKVDETGCRASESENSLRSFPELTTFSDKESRYELHRRRPSQEDYHGLRHGPEGPSSDPRDALLRPARQDPRVLPRVAALQGRGRGNRELLLVRGGPGAAGRTDRAGQPEQAACYCREHKKDRPPRCPDPGRIPGQGHDSPGLHAHSQTKAAPRL